MRITSKGQVTIPIDIREKAGLLPDTEVEFDIDEATGRVYVTRRDGRGQRRARALIDHMRGRLNSGLTPDEILALTRGDE